MLCPACPCSPGRQCPLPAPSCGGDWDWRARRPTSAFPTPPCGAATRVGWRCRRASRCSPASRGSAVPWADSHCHVQYDGVGLDAVEEAVGAGVMRIVCVGTDAEESRRAIEVARAAPDVVRATAGLHPHDAVQGAESIVALLDEPEVVAVGECGLDYHYGRS